MRGDVFDPSSLQKQPGADRSGQAFFGLISLAVLAAFVMVGAVFWDVVQGSWDISTSRMWGFVSTSFVSNPDEAGVAQGIRGSLIIAGIVIVSFPIGIGAAVYLEEYATDSWTTRLIQVTVRNLAGVPSIVYGLLGLAVFVQTLKGLTGGDSVISGVRRGYHRSSCSRLPAPWAKLPRFLLWVLPGTTPPATTTSWSRCVAPLLRCP